MSYAECEAPVDASRARANAAELCYPRLCLELGRRAGHVEWGQGMRGLVVVATAFALNAAPSCAHGGTTGTIITPELAAELRAGYLETLDRLAKLPRSKENDTTTGKTCGKLIVLVASDKVEKELAANDGTEYYYLVGKCIQIQRFRTSDVPLKVDAYDRLTSCVVTDKRVPIFNELCRRAGLIP